MYYFQETMLGNTGTLYNGALSVQNCQCNGSLGKCMHKLNCSREQPNFLDQDQTLLYTASNRNVEIETSMYVLRILPNVEHCLCSPMVILKTVICGEIFCLLSVTAARDDLG